MHICDWVENEERILVPPAQQVHNAVDYISHLMRQVSIAIIHYI